MAKKSEEDILRELQHLVDLKKRKYNVGHSRCLQGISRPLRTKKVLDFIFSHKESFTFLL